MDYNPTQQKQQPNIDSKPQTPAKSNKKGKIMTGVFGGLAAAGLVAAIVVPIVTKPTIPVAEETKAHTIELPQAAIEGGTIKSDKVEAKKGDKVIFNITYNQNDDPQKIPSALVINASNCYNLTKVSDTEYQTELTIPFIENMTVSLQFQTVDTITITFDPMEGKLFQGSLTQIITKNKSFKDINSPIVTKQNETFVCGYDQELKPITLIGVNHDKLTSNPEKFAALTFETVNAICSSDSKAINEPGHQASKNLA